MLHDLWDRTNNRATTYHKSIRVKANERHSHTSLLNYTNPKLKKHIVTARHLTIDPTGLTASKERFLRRSGPSGTYHPLEELLSSIHEHAHHLKRKIPSQVRYSSSSGRTPNTCPRACVVGYACDQQGRLGLRCGTEKSHAYLVSDRQNPQ